MREQDSPSSGLSHLERRWIDAFRLQGDTTAFEALIANHRDSVFDLARRILRDDNLAEDVSQETLLAFFNILRTQTFDAPVRPWLLEAVRRRALERRRSNSRRMSREACYVMKHSGDSAESTSVRPFESAELHQALDSLPEEFQIPVALFYLHGLQRSEVAAMLKVPDGTVASRIARGLERLRAILDGKGRTVSAAASIVALEAGLKALPLAKAPNTIGALETIRQLNAVKIAAKSARHVVRLAPKVSGQISLASVMVIGAAVAGGAWWALSVETRPKPAVPTAVAPASVSPPQPATKTDSNDSLNAHWAFEKGPPTDIEVLKGAWVWKPATATEKACMSMRGVYLLLPQRLPPKPLLLTVKCKTLPEHSNFNTARCDGNQLLGFDVWNDKPSFLTHTHSFDVSAYFFDRFGVILWDGKLSSVQQYKSTNAGDRLLLLFENYDLFEINLRSISPIEVPERLRNVEKLKREIGQEPVQVLQEQVRAQQQ